MKKSLFSYNDIPVPNATFQERLRRNLLSAHEDAIKKTTHHPFQWQWFLSLPVVAILVLSVFLTSTFGPALSPEQFLERAHAAALAVKNQKGIEYSKKRQVFMMEQEGTELFVQSPRIPPYNTPYISESWVIENPDGTFFARYKDSQEDGTIIRDDMMHFIDADMLVSDHIWMFLPKETQDTFPICAAGIYNEESFDPWTDEELKAMSGSKIGGSDTGTDLFMQLSDPEFDVRIAALTELQKMGEATDEGLSTIQGNEVRTFTMSTGTSSFSADGKATVYPDTVKILLSFNTKTYEILQEEWYNIDPETRVQTLSQRIEYLEHQFMSESVESIFDPNHYNLIDPWTLLPFTQKDVESKKAKAGCYFNGKYLGDGSFVVLDALGSEMHNATLNLHFDNRNSIQKSQKNTLLQQ